MADTTRLRKFAQTIATRCAREGLAIPTDACVIGRAERKGWKRIALYTERQVTDQVIAAVLVLQADAPAFLAVGAKTPYNPYAPPALAVAVFKAERTVLT